MATTYCACRPPATDKVELIGTWSEAAPTTIDSVTDRQFALGGETALISGTGIVTIAGAPSAVAQGLDPIASGPVAPLPTRSPA